MAEELLFYRSSGLSPRSNIDATTIRASANRIAAFNNYESSNFGRFQSYLEKPAPYSPITANDSLETRGASWS